MRKQITAQQAYGAYVNGKQRKINKPVVKINECPDCNGTGKQGKRTCSTCGGEKDN